MNSPFNALTVFTKFMSSPTDALEIISKIVSSPQDVLQFIKNLMDSPEEGLEIMNKFMNTPAEALKIINKIFNGNATAATAARVNESVDNELLQDTIIKSTALLQSQQQIATSLTSDTEDNLSIASPPELQPQNSIINSMLTPSPELSSVLMPTSPMQSNDLVYDPLTPTNSAYSHSPRSPPTPILHTQQIPANLPLTPAASVIESNLMQYSIKSSTSTNITSSHSPNIAVDPSNMPNMSAHQGAEAYEAKTCNLNTFPPSASSSSSSAIHHHHNMTSAPDSSLNSLESVLSEVIRIEFQACNNLPSESRIKQEQMHALHGQNSMSNSTTAGSGCFAAGLGLNTAASAHTQHQQQSVYSPTGSTRDLNDTEQMKLRELKLASEALYLPVDDDLSVLMGDDRIKVSITYLQI